MKLFTTVLLSLVSTALAFESTVPCLMWSPKNYIAPPVNNDQFIMSQKDSSRKIMSSLSADICSAKLIAVVNHPELHVNDLTTSSFSALKEHNSKAYSRAQFEYVSEGVDIKNIAQMIATQCDTTLAILDPTTMTVDDLSTPVVAVISLPETESNDVFGNMMRVIENAVQDDYAVIYSSNEAKSVPVKRMLKKRAPETTADLPIFAKYQLFTPGVFMVLGVVILFLLIGGTGIAWLVGIQTPVRFEGKQKKN